MNSIFTGAMIGDEHTLRDWGSAITNSDVISMPEAKTVLLEVPGRSGRLDLSEVLTGDVAYGNREIKLKLAAKTNREKWVKPAITFSINITAGWFKSHLMRTPAITM